MSLILRFVFCFAGFCLTTHSLANSHASTRGSTALTSLGQLSIWSLSHFRSDTILAGSNDVIFVEWNLSRAASNVARDSASTLWDEYDPCYYIEHPDEDVPTLALAVEDSLYAKTHSEDSILSLLRLSPYELRKSNWEECYCQHLDDYIRVEDPRATLSTRSFGYALEVSESFPETSIVLNAELRDSLGAAIKATKRFHVRNPRTVEDQKELVKSRLDLCRRQENFLRFSEIADSASNLGLLSSNVVLDAYYFSRYNSAVAELKNLDLRWKRTGQMLTSGPRCGNEIPWPGQPGAQRREYQRLHSIAQHRLYFPSELPRFAITLDEPFEVVNGAAVYRVLAGSTVRLDLTWSSDRPGEDYRFMTKDEQDALAGGHELEITVGSDLQECFVAASQGDSLLLEQAIPKGYQSKYDSMYMCCRIIPTSYTKVYNLSAPEYLAGMYVRVAGNYVDSDGRRYSDSMSVEVITPQSRGEWEEWYSQTLGKLRLNGNNAAAIGMVDSMIAMGYCFPEALLHGWFAATAEKQYQKALDFMDAGWKMNGYFQGNGFVPIPFSDNAKSDYEKFRKITQNRLEGKSEMMLYQFFEK